jgi:hypothetical protein
MATLTAPVVSKVDLILALSNLWDVSDSSMFVDSSETGYEACSITFFKGDYRSTIGLVYTKKGGAARIFNVNMDTIAQSIEKFSQADYYGIRNMMLKIQKGLPMPVGVDLEDLLKKIKEER